MSDRPSNEVRSDPGEGLFGRDEEEQEGARGRSGSKASGSSLEGFRRHLQEAEEEAAREALAAAEAAEAEARAGAAAAAAAAEAQRAKQKSAPPRPDGRLVVGDRVVLRPGADGDGHLSPGDIGVITDADDSHLPYHVEFEGRKKWYRKDQVELYDPSEVRVTAYEVQFDGRKWWYAEKALSKHPDSPTPVEAPLSVGDLVTLTREYRSEPDAANGVLWPGATGKVVACHVVVGGRTWWYDKDDQEALRDHVAALGVPRMTAKSKVNLWVGDKVVLSDNYAEFGEAAEGPLTPGDVGEIVSCDNSHLPYLVQFEGSTWFYAAGALQKYEPPESKDEDAAKEEGGGDGQAPGSARSRESSASGASRAPSTHTEDLRIVVSGCQDSKFNGTYMRGDRTWGGKPLYQREDAEGTYLYWTSRDGQKEGWNLGPSDTDCWVYYAPGGSDTVPPTTGWTARDDSTSGLPKVRFKGGQVKGEQIGLVVGDKVVLSSDFRNFGDAAEGPLAPGDVGEIVQDDRSALPYRVKSRSGSTWWYAAGALQKYTAQQNDGGEAKTVCPQGHPLVAFATPNGSFSCDSDACRDKARKPEGTQMYGCRRCNYDLCVECMGKAQEPERAKTPPPRNSAPQVLKRKEVGLRVRRGPDWKWGDQDGGEGTLGTTCEDRDDGWIAVQWDNGGKFSYRVGKDGKYDLVLAEDEAQVQERATPAHNIGAPQVLNRKEVGLRVRRGPDWKWGDQDGGEGKLGTTCEDEHEGWISVRWDHGVKNAYRVGKDGKYDLVIADDEAATPAAIKVGDSVRVSEKVSEPAYGWGQVRHKMVGVVVQDNGEDVEVDFPEQKGWRGRRSELEKDQPEKAADPNSVAVGDLVLVSERVSEPHYGWGDVKHQMVGIVVKQEGDDLKVDFPDHKGWRGKRSELEKVSASDAPVQVASSGSIRVGDLVRVSEKVSEPMYGWGAVKHKMVGRVVKEDGADIKVDFPTQKGWTCKRSELEKLDGDSAPAEGAARTESYGVAPLVVGDEVVLVSAYRLFGDAASGPLSPGDRGKIESTSEGRINVSFNGRTWWYDPAALRRPGDLVVQAETPSALIKVGDQVRVSPSVKEPKYNWGSVVKHGMVGIVTVDEGDSLRVSFPGAPNWHAARDELEKVGPIEQAPVCPRGHPLAIFVTTGACSCKSTVCRGKAQKPEGENMYACRRCSYELCAECFAEAGKGGAVPISAQVGEKYMFVRTSDHNYSGRCASQEVVEVVEVAEAGATPPLPVQVKWPSGFTHGAHYEDLRYLDGLPLRGGKVLETAGVKEHFYWAFCAGGVIRDSGREFLKVDWDPVPATGSAGPARVVVNECGNWTYDGVYVLKEDKEWRGKPLYVKDGVEDKFCYWADRDEDGLGQGWNLGTNNTAEGWVYFAATTSETPPSTGWTAKDGKTTGLPKVTFIPGSPMVTNGVRALGALPDDAAWQVEFTDVGSHWAAGVATVEAPLSGSAYVLGDEDFRESWAVCFGKSGRVLARHRGHERELKDYEYVQPSLGGLPRLAGLLGELGELHKKLGLQERPPFVLKFWRRNGRTLVVQLPGESKEQVLFTNLSSQPLYVVAATAKVGSSVRLRGQDSPVKVAQPESEDESESWCSSPSSSYKEESKREKEDACLDLTDKEEAALLE